jgi:hypothetical protein
MGIFLNTAAYGYYPVVGGGGPVSSCTATQQEAGYTYYRVKSGVDASIPEWTVRFANSVTGSNSAVGYALYCANAQYASASFTSASVIQQASPLSDRITSGSNVASYGLAGWIVGFSSQSCFTDEWTITTCNSSISSTCSTIYGGNFSTSFIGFILRDRTRFTGITGGQNWNNWGNQPPIGKCSSYNSNGANAHSYVSCSLGTSFTSSLSEYVCASQYSQTAGTPIIKNYYTGSCIDPNAQLFVDATGITGSNVTAINNLVIGLKTNNLWDKMNVIYPFIGGTANTNKYNLINPQDTNAAFRIQFNGTVTHNFSGSAGNGSGGYGRTYYAPSGNVTLNSEHISCYINTNNTTAQSDTVELGVNQSSNTQASIFGVKTGNNFTCRLNSQVVQYSNTDAKGFYTITKNGSTTLNAYKGSTLQNSGTSAGTLPTINMLLWTAAVNTDTPYAQGYSNQSFAFVSFGDGLSATDVSNLNTVVQAYQTELGRQV